MRTPLKSLTATCAAASLWAGAALAQEAATFPVGDENPVIAILQVGEPTMRAGDEYQYELRVRNVSSMPAHDVKVTQIVAGGFEIQQSQPKMMSNAAASAQQKQERQRQIDALQRSGNGNESQQQGDQQQGDQQQGDQPAMATWMLGMLMPDELKTIEVTARAGQEGTLQNCLVAEFQQAVCTEILVTKPELTLTRYYVGAEGVRGNLFFACDPFGVIYEVTNEGTGETPPVIILEELPEGLALEDGGDVVSLEIGSLSAGETVARMVKLSADKAGEFESGARAEAGDLTASSNQDSLQIIQPELELTVDGPSEQYLGREVRYQVTVKNTSDQAPALDTIVTIPGLDKLLRFTSTGELVDPSVDVFRIGRIAPGESETFGLAFEASEPGEISTQVTATAYCAADVTEEITTDIQGIAALQVMVVDQKDPVPVGETTIYEIKVLNEGTEKGVDIQLTGQLPSEVEFVEATGSGEVQADGQNLTFSKIPELQPGDSVGWNVLVRGAEAGKVKFKTTLSSTAGREIVSSEPTTIY